MRHFNWNTMPSMARLSTLDTTPRRDGVLDMDARNTSRQRPARSIRSPFTHR